VLKRRTRNARLSPQRPPQNAYQDCHNFIFVMLVAKMLAKYARF